MSGYGNDLRENIASAPAGKLAVMTIELRHPAFDPPTARFVNNTEPFTGTLEDDAPLDAGETVTFTASRFDAKLPESIDTGLPTFDLEITNVASELTPWMEAAIGVGAAIELSVRQFLVDDPSAPQQVIHGMTFKSAHAGILRVIAQAGFEDLLNMPFGRRLYLVKDYPTLVRV